MYHNLKYTCNYLHMEIDIALSDMMVVIMEAVVMVTILNAVTPVTSY